MVSNSRSLCTDTKGHYGQAIVAVIVEIRTDTIIRQLSQSVSLKIRRDNMGRQ